VTAALATDTALAWETRLRRRGVPAVAVRTLPEALAAAHDAIITAGPHRQIATPVRITGHNPTYRPPPRLGEHDP
jgi:CoA:oxalate CoA-transferase